MSATDEEERRGVRPFLESSELVEAYYGGTRIEGGIPAEVSLTDMEIHAVSGAADGDGYYATVTAEWQGGLASFDVVGFLSDGAALSSYPSIQREFLEEKYARQAVEELLEGTEAVVKACSEALPTTVSQEKYQNAKRRFNAAAKRLAYITPDEATEVRYNLLRTRILSEQYLQTVEQEKADGGVTDEDFSVSYRDAREVEELAWQAYNASCYRHGLCSRTTGY